jgi:ribosomal protein S10
MAAGDGSMRRATIAGKHRIVRRPHDVGTLNASEFMMVLHYRTILLLACAPVLAQSIRSRQLPGGRQVRF